MITATPNDGALLREVARLYTRAQRAIADACDSTASQCHILTELQRSGPITMNELGNRLMLEKSWISRAVEGLTQRDLVSKTANPADARSWVVSLTAAGLRKVRSLNHTLDGHASSLLAPLSERERRQVQRALSVLLGVLRDDAEPAACT